jgi:hypothetical protein
MARKQIVELVDDIDGGEAAKTVHFGYAGTDYEIDLNEKNAAALESALAPYLAAGRRAGRSRATRDGGAQGSGRDYDPSVVRAWAKRQGLEVSQRGRVSKELVEQWRQAS